MKEHKVKAKKLAKQIKILQAELDKINGLKQKRIKLRSICNHKETIRNTLYIEDLDTSNIFNRYPMINLTFYLSDKTIDNIILLIQNDLESQIEEIDKQIKEFEETE